VLGFEKLGGFWVFCVLVWFLKFLLSKGGVWLVLQMFGVFGS